jgi:predicted amidophosphoribosyltransferase
MLLASGCVCCGRPGGPICGPCAEALEPAPALGHLGIEARALLRYSGVGRELIGILKYRHGRRLAAPFGRLLAELLPVDGVDVVTWVPASHEGRRARGFDQGRLLAAALARRNRLPLRALLRRGAGPPQTGRSGPDRSLGPSLSARRRGAGRVAVVDDVITTRTTLTVAHHPLQDAGWGPVVTVAVAATPLRFPSARRAQGRPGPIEPKMDSGATDCPYN